MGSPSSSLATLRPDLGGSLEEFDLAMDRAGFIGLRVMPVFDVAKQAGSYGLIPLEQLLQNRDTARSPGSGYSRGKFTFQSTTYGCSEHGAEEPVDDREAEMYAEYFDAELVATERARDVVLRNHEKRAAAAIFNATTWTSNKTTVTNEWDDATNAVPITDVENACREVWEASGLWPNALILERYVARNLRHCAQIIDRLKYQGFRDVIPSQINAAMLAAVFDLEEVIIAGSAKNSAAEGQDASIAPIWSREYAMVAKIARSRDIKEPCLGRTLHWAADGSQIGATVETYRDETVRSDIVRARHDVQEKIHYVQAGHLLENVTTL